MKRDSARYRLTTRNIQWGGVQKADLEKAHEKLSDTPAPIGDNYHRIAKAIEDLYLPHVGELLSRISTYDLAPWQRTCVWAQGWRIHESVIRSPRAIVPFLSAYNTLESAEEIRTPGREAQACEAELRLLRAFEGDDPSELNVQTLLGKIAALSLFEKSKWGRIERDSIFQQALASAEMSYFFAAATSPTIIAWNSLAEIISNWPRLSFATLRLPHLPISADLLSARDLLTKCVSQHAVFEWAIRFRSRGYDLRQMIDDFTAKSCPTSAECTLALLVAPNHQRVPEWLTELQGQPQLAYEVRRLLSLSHQPEAEFVLAPKLGAIAMSDPRWAFHWLRDFGEDDEETALSLFPNLEWIAELMDCGVLSTEHANLIDDKAAQSMEMDHWLRSSFLLFAANKLKGNEKN